METELFMECEEEELEPWQQVDDSVEEDEVDFMDTYREPVNGSPSPPPTSETPPTRTPPPITQPLTASSPPVLLPSSSSSVPARPPAVSVSSCAPSAPPIMTQAPPLILTQTAGGAFLLPAAPGTGNRQPILLTTQGFPVQTVMNPGGQLLLNLQTGQTVQPLTLFQSSSALGQLVRPSVGVSPVIPQGHAIQSRAAAAAGGSAFSAVQLPTTLTIRTTTPKAVNLQVTRVGGANTLKLAGSPALPSGSANGMAHVTAFSSSPSTGVSAPSVVMTPSVTSGSSRVVMTVEEFYYGTFEGDLSLRKPPPLGIQTSTFTCQICSHLAENNLRLMQHMLQHSDLVDGGGGCDEKKCCRFCYRQFSSPAQLQSHQEQVHGPAHSSSMCRICEWAFENEPAFLNHMKTNHRPGEMPYICQVCSYRSSFYSNVLQHFASFHRDSRFLLCVFCLKVTRNPVSYQQHLLRHQTSQAFHCNRCRLQFVFLKDKMQHKLENHRSFRRPAQLEGLPPGSKVTIRTYGKVRPQPAGGRLLHGPASLIQPINIKTEALRAPLHKSALSRSPRSLTKRPVNRRLLVRRSTGEDHLVCLECGTDASDVSAHYPTHVHCLLCPYSSCCSRAYAAHMIHHHVPPSKEQNLPLHQLPPPCVFLLSCSGCDFRPQTADQMAEHLLLNPLHHSATCCRKAFVEQDIQFSHTEQLQLLEDQDQDQDQDPPGLSWCSADAEGQPAVIPFIHLSGPRPNLSKSSDAIDFFNLLFPPALVELITAETNAHARICQFLGWSSQSWVPVTTHEIKGFIGLVVLMGIQNLPNPAHYWSWSHYDNSYTFYRAMSFKRFNQIAANIRMGSWVTEQHRGAAAAADPLHLFRPMLDILGGAMGGAYRPNCCLTIDRALLPGPEERGGAAKAPAKARPQVWLLCDSKSGYCHRLHIQVEQKAGRELGFTVVPELVRGLEGKHHQLYLANALASVPLAQRLLDQGLYASSSFPPLSPILPRPLWEEGRLDRPGDFLQRRLGPLLATRWRDAKEMGCLSTNAAPGRTDTVWRRSQSKAGELDPVDRPLAFRLLQENMRGVDICKQLLACNPLGGVPQDRHWRSLFWFLVNLSIVNAFIVLRESRKDNPPAWVQDGLFSQLTFRKRLGNQLAKCAQKHFDTMEMAGSRRAKAEDGPAGQRHRLAKISGVPRRCRVCGLKNLRRETVYGCAPCRASLCKQPACFWEFHGLPTHGQGSTKVGFLKDRISGQLEVDGLRDGLRDGVDPSMAPVEDLDFTDEEEPQDAEESRALQEDLPEEDRRPAVRRLAPPAGSSKEREDVLSARQLRVALFALCSGLRSASRFFSTDVQLIRRWLKEARKQLQPSEPEGPEGPELGGDGAARMTGWVLSMREQQLPITESGLFHQASALKKAGGFGDSFRISYAWAVGFLLRRRLGARGAGRPPALTAPLPAALQARAASFREFTQKVVRVHRLGDGAVAAMDELCLFVDFALAEDRARRSEALELTGTVPLLTVFLTVLADGAALPALLLTARPPAGKAPPGSVLLECSPEGAAPEEGLDLWARKVWLQHASGRAQKSLLVLDRHREHTRDPFLASVSGSGTLPALIPDGCSFCLQPLEVCVKPALQRYLLARWAAFTAGNPEELDPADPQRLRGNVVQLLVDWLGEALTCLSKLPHLWKKSFSLTGLLPPPSEEDQQPDQAQPDQAQPDLLRTLMENLLGSEAPDVPDLLEPEDEDATEEEQNGRGGSEATKKTEDSTMEDQGAMKDEAEEKTEEAQRAEQDSEEEEMEEEQEEQEEEQEEQEEEQEEVEEEQEEEQEEVEEDQGEVSKERRETRIVIGEDVGDEWKITVKSRTEEDES